MRAAEYDVIATQNYLGCRGSTVVDDPDALFIGDSFTYGFGLNASDTIPAQVIRPWTSRLKEFVLQQSPMAGILV